MHCALFLKLINRFSRSKKGRKGRKEAQSAQRNIFYKPHLNSNSSLRSLRNLCVAITSDEALISRFHK